MKELTFWGQKWNFQVKFTQKTHDLCSWLLRSFQWGEVNRFETGGSFLMTTWHWQVSDNLIQIFMSRCVSKTLKIVKTWKLSLPWRHQFHCYHWSWLEVELWNLRGNQIPKVKIAKVQGSQRLLKLWLSLIEFRVLILERSVLLSITFQFLISIQGNNH